MRLQNSSYECIKTVILKDVDKSSDIPKQKTYDN